MTTYGHLFVKVIEQDFQLRCLDFAQEQNLVLGKTARGCSFAGIDEREWIPFTVMDEAPTELLFVFEKIRCFCGERFKAGVPAHALEPVLGIAVVRFTAVHDAVKITAIRTFDVLGDRVRCVELIVPEQDRRADQKVALRPKNSVNFGD